MKTAVPSSRGSASGSNGTIGLKSTAARKSPGRRNKRLVAMFAPLENPTATIPSRSREYVDVAASMNAASSSVLFARSS